VQNARFELQHTEKEEKSASLLKKWPRDHHTPALLNTMGCRNEGGLSAVVPIFWTMAKVKKPSSLRLFQVAIDYPSWTTTASRGSRA
jgi:hypothetical protein